MEWNRCFGCMEETKALPCPYCGYDPRVRTQLGYALREGTILNGKYLVGKVLGQGGFGITYIGWDIALSQKVAIKEYFPASCVTRDPHTGSVLQWLNTEHGREARSLGREMFLKEARKMSRAAAIPGVVQVLDLFEDNDTAYIIMEFVQGGNLMDRIAKMGPLPWQSVKALLLPVAATMQKVHEAGLIHRDLSPDNLMLQPDGSVKILDLGAAKDLKLNSGASSAQVAKGGFSPLEQYVQRGNSGPWTDVYSLAATMYYALTGVVPLSAVDRIDQDPVRWDLPQLQKIPAAVVQVLKQALALRTEDRIQTMDAFVQSIHRADSGKVRRKAGKMILAIASAFAVCLGIHLACLAWGIHFGERAKGLNPYPEDMEKMIQEEPLTAEAEQPWGSNVLMVSAIPEEFRYDMDGAPVFNSRIARRQILSVTFLDSTENAGSNSWDISHARDGSVLAWTEPNGTQSVWNGDKIVEEDRYDLYIGADGGVNGKYCSRLFSGFQNMESIAFNGCFHTDYAESMEEMFSGCFTLKRIHVQELETGCVRNMQNMFRNCAIQEVDLQGFDTANVVNMRGMFANCDELTSLDLSGFDTSKVTDMGDMFSMCSKLMQLDISSFDTSCVRNMSFMFSYTEFETLDLSHFDTSMVTSMSYMFSNADRLRTIDLRNFNTSCVESMAGMFQGCASLQRVEGVEDWDTSNVRSFDSFMDEGILINGSPWEEIFR